MNGCSSLLRAINLPHYIHEPTRGQVLSTLRQILRQAHRSPLALVNNQLSHMTMHAFHGCKYVTDPSRIDALLRVARDELRVLNNAFNNNDQHAYRMVLDRAFYGFKTRNSPFWRILKQLMHGKNLLHHRSRPAVLPKQLETQLRDSAILAPLSVAYRFNNLPTPKYRTIAEYKEQAKLLSHEYFKFIHFLKSNKITSGISGRKLFFEPTPVYTALGVPAAPCRERNLVTKVYAHILRDSFKPVHKDVIEYIDKVMDDPRLVRFVRRRLEECADDYYSVDDNYSIIRSKIYK